MKKLALLLLVLIAFSGCQKEKQRTMYKISSSDYYPMTVGSYWIYERTQIDTNGVETTTPDNNDSVYVSRDTLINGKTFAVFVGTIWWDPAQELYMRDSAGHVLSSSGTILDLTNFSGILDFYHDSSGMSDATTYMEHPPGPITVPAGTFSTVDRVCRIDILIPSYPWGTPRYLHDYYALGVGRVREISCYSSAPWYQSRRLLRYHIE